MHRSRARIGLGVRSLGNAKYLQARRFVWLVMLIVTASLAEGSLAAVARKSAATSGGEQVFRLGRLAPTRGGWAQRIAPVLARLNGIVGVESSSASVGNPEGTLVRVSIRPGADSAKIAAEVQRVLSEAVKDRSPVPLPLPATAAALQQKEWLNSEQLVNLAVTDSGSSDGRAPILLLALLLATVVLVLGLCGWRQLRRRQAGSSGP